MCSLTVESATSEMPSGALAALMQDSLRSSQAKKSSSRTLLMCKSALKVNSSQSRQPSDKR